MTLDVVVFLFGALVSTLVGAGLLVLFYGYAYAEQAKRENIQLSERMQRVVRFILGEDAL
jgi:Flp pilus assembly protein TadB